MNASRLNPVDIALFVKAMLMARRAQQVRRVPIPAVAEDLVGWRAISRAHSVERLSTAADRGSSRWARWFGGLDSCLIRSLVLSALLAGRGEVVLNVGFRRDEGGASLLAGHAWVTLDGEPVGSDGHLAETSYTRVLEVPLVGKSDG